MTPGPILHVNAETTWRGGENQVFLLARGLHETLPTAIACVPGSPLHAKASAAGVPVHALPGDRGLGAILALRGLVRDLRPRLLHAHTSRAHQLCLLATLGSALPIMVTRRVDFPLKRGIIARWKYGRRITRFVAISQAISRILQAGGVPAERIAVIPSGIPFDAVDQAPRRDPREAFGLPADAIVVINVAALSDHKDHETLLDAWAQVEPSRPLAHLIIAGEGELRQRLEERIATLGLQRTRLVGHRDDVWNLLKGSDLFVMSSHLEGLCTSIMDAKRCGLPVVATRAGGIPEVVDADNGGVLVPTRDVSALATALARLIDDPGERGTLAAAAAKDSVRFTAEHMVQAYRRLYTELLTAPPTATFA